MESHLVDDLLQDAQVVSGATGEFIFHAGDECGAFLILLEGSVRVQLTALSGREFTLYRIEPGGTCVLTTSCMFSHQQFPAEAIAETPIKALAIPARQFQAALEASEAFRRYVFDGFSQRLTSVIQKVEEIAFTPIDARLASALLERYGKGIEEMTHQELAVELGTAREVISRHLKRFEEQGWVRLARSRVQVMKPEALTSAASRELSD